jgi:hypothetical protein
VVKAEIDKRDRGIEIMKKAGVELYQLPFEEKVRWAKVMPNYPDQKAKEADKKGMPGSVLIKAYIAELEKEGYKFPRRWVVQ